VFTDAVISRTTSAPASGLLAAITTVAPSQANARAVARPMPELRQ
jgi:hypothetical protein